MAKKTHDEISRLFAKRFEDYNTKILIDIAETIKQFKGLNYTQAHRLAQQLKYNRNYQQLINELSTLSEETKIDIRKLLDETAKQDLEFADVYFKARNKQTPLYENNYRLQSIASAVYNVSSQDFNNIAQSTGFRTFDENNNIIYTSIGETYNNVIDECVYAVSTGQDTFDNVMRSTINQLADSGIRKIYYENLGKRPYSQRLDSAVRRNILDSIRQINNETQIELGEEFGADGVEITVHENSAEDHFEAQGKQFTNEEFAKLMAEGKATDYKGNIVDIRRPRKRGGFFHRPISDYNCYHTAFAVVLGVSDPLYSEEELQEIEENNNRGVIIDGVHYTRYEATQIQRKIETEIRKAKDAHIMYKTTDDRPAMLKEQKRITQLTHKYNEIVQKGLPNQIKRATVSGYRPIKKE